MRKLKLFLSLLMLITFSVGTVWGQAAAGTTLFSEDFSSYKKDGVPSGSVTTASGRVVYDGGSVTYSVTNGGGTTKIYEETTAGGKSPEILIGKSNGTLVIAGIPSGDAKVITVSYKQNKQKLKVEASGTGYSGSLENKPSASVTNSFDVTVADGAAATFTLTFTCSGSSNIRVDDILVTVKTAGTPAGCTNTVTITKGSETNGTYTLGATEICGDGDGGEVIISDITPASGYTFDEITTSASGVVDNTNKKVTGIKANTTITVKFKALPKYTVQFNTGAGNAAQADITEATAGAGITLPAGPTPACSADGWTFAGWAEAAVASETTTAPTLFATDATYKPTDNVTLYAVYSKTEGASAVSGNTTITTDISGVTGSYADGTDKGDYKWSFTQLMKGSSSMQGNSSKSSILWNTVAFPAAISKVELVVGAAAGASNTAGLCFATSVKPTDVNVSMGSGTSYSLTETGTLIITSGIPANSTYMSLKWTSGASYYSSVKVYWGNAGTTYYLSAPSCCTKHSVNIALGIQYGKVEADLAEACEGTEVTLTATPNEHCRFVKWDVKQSETPVAVSDNKFTMPDGNVTVSATFEEIRNAANVSNPEHGTITVTGADNLASVLEGTELSVSVTGAGYNFTLKAYKSGDELTVVPITDGKLTMPAYGIVITADEQELVSPTILVSKDVIDFGSAVKGAAAPEVQTFTISGANLTGDLLLAWEESDGYFTWKVTEGSLTANAGIVEATISVTATEKAMNTAGTLMDNMIISGGGATQKEVVVGVEVQQTYTAKWFVNGEELTESTQTALAGTDLIVPTNPTKLADDCDDMIFKGWAEAPIEGKQDDAPAYTEKTKMPEANVNFYAVFASEVPGAPVQKVDNIDNAFIGVSGTNYVVWTNKVGVSGAVYAGSSAGGNDAVQLRSNKDADGLVVTSTGAGKVTNVTVAWNTNTAATRTIDIYGKNTPYSAASDLYGANAGTLLGSINIDNATSLDVTGDYTYIGIRSNSGALYLDNIAVKWTAPGETTYTDYMTTCQSCAKVNLMKAATEHGSYTFQQSGIAVTSVKTCDAAATVDVVFEPELGYELANFQISELDGVSYADGVITIAKNAAGDLSTTATFAPKNYSVTMTQTGYAEATLSEDQTNKHIGNEITISTTLPEGYYFVGWEATPTVAFADAKAPNTTFTMPASDVTIKAKFAWIRSVAEALAKIPNENDFFGGAAVEGYVSGNISYNDTYKSLTYDIRAVDANGFLTGDVLQVYSGKGIDGADFSSVNDIKVGAKVRIYGDLKNYGGTREFNASSKQFYYVKAVNPSVEVYGEATKIAYEVGDKFDFAGLGAKTVYDNGYATAIAEPELTAAPATIAANTESVSVTANGSSAKVVNVTVNTHAVTFEAPANGTLVVKNAGVAITSGDAFVKGTVLTVEATPIDANYALTALTAGGNDILAAKQFEVGTAAIAVAATFAEKAVAELAWTAAEATAVDYEGAVNALPTLTNAASLEVAYESTNTDVAEIAANGDVTIKAAGTATIKAIFAGNETYKAATVTYELTVSHVPVVKLAGTFNSWTGALLTPNEDYTEASVKVNFTADSWPLFKMIVDEAWLGLPMDGEKYYLFHRDWTTAAIEGAGGDIQLKADFEGEYTFTWTYATNTLTITFPDMPESEYYIAGDFTTWETNMAKMTEDAGMYKATVTINATEKQLFKVVRVQGPYKIWYGLAGEATMTSDDCENWIIGGGNANIGLQPNYAGKYTFYFVPEDMKLTIDMPTEPGTALDNTEAGEKAAKVMQNGQLLIIKNGKTFNAQGAVVK